MESRRPSKKGLLNAPSEYNCFLNVIVQSLWHLDPFRLLFNTVAHRHVKEHMKKPEADRLKCIVCSLRLIFTQLQFDESANLSSANLRLALSVVYEQSGKFRLNEMEDASECLQAILQCIHHELHGNSSPTCQHPDCPVHRIFGYGLSESDTSSNVSYQLIYYLTAAMPSATLESSSSSEQTLRRKQSKHIFDFFSTIGPREIAFRDSMCTDSGPFENAMKTDSPFVVVSKDAGAGPKAADAAAAEPSKRVLKHIPPVFTVELGWGSATASAEEVSSIFAILPRTMDVRHIFSVISSDAVYRLQAFVCYYGCHYVNISFSNSSSSWYLFDDSHVRKIGVKWSAVVRHCVLGKLQPSILFYVRAPLSNLEAAQMDPEEAVPSGTPRFGKPDFVRAKTTDERKFVSMQELGSFLTTDDLGKSKKTNPIKDMIHHFRRHKKSFSTTMADTDKPPPP